MLRSNPGVIAGGMNWVAGRWKNEFTVINNSTILPNADFYLGVSGVSLTATSILNNSDPGSTLGSVEYDTDTGYFTGITRCTDQATPTGTILYIQGSSLGIRARFVKGSDTGYTSYLAFDKVTGFETATYRATSGSLWIEVEGVGGALIVRLHSVVSREFAPLSFRIDRDPAMYNLSTHTPIAYGSAIAVRCVGDVFQVSFDDGETYTEYASNTTVSSIAELNSKVRVQARGQIDRLALSGNNHSDCTILDGTRLTTLSGMCQNSPALQTFNATDLSNVTDFGQAWRGCSQLTSFPAITTTSAYQVDEAWLGCTGLTAFPTLDLNGCIDVGYAWSGCSNITNFQSQDFSTVLSFDYAFNGCNGLTSMPAINSTNGTVFNNMFNNCSNLVCLTSIDTTNQVTTANMFSGCTSLTNPTSGEITSILAGSSYTNGGSCP